MPRKKKGGQSPARVPSGLLEGGTNAGNRVPPVASSLIPGSLLQGAAKEDIVRNMQEMFSHLDREVIYIVLYECDFKVENAMDSLLELSNAATDPQPVLTSESGFERTAAALITPHHVEESNSLTDTSAQLQCSSTSPTSLMTEDLDFLIDQEVLSLSAEDTVERYQQDSEIITHTKCPQSKLDNKFSGMSIDKLSFLYNSQRSGASSPLDQLSAFEEVQNQLSVVDDPPMETFVEKNIPSTDVFTSTHPALQISSKLSISNPDDPALNSSTLNESMGYSEPITWNIEAPVFYPQTQERQAPAFITPVVSNWPREPKPTIPWHRPISQAQVRPCLPISKSWALPRPQPLNHSRLRLEGKVLVLLRGPPGSGKSTLARALLEHNPGGVVLSTDDFFIVNGKYHFDPNVLGEAHSWNHNRAKQALEGGANPIIIDNTNMQGWEMKPYVVMALKHHYKVLFREPDTWWKYKPKELERRTKHGVPSERIRRMLCGYERFVTVKSILGSQITERKQVAAETEEKLVNCLKPEVPCPDFAGETNEKTIQPHSEAAPSLPDVLTTHDSDNCTDTLINTDMDMGALDSELDKLDYSEEVSSDSTGVSDFNKKYSLDEIPVAFSESIGQRIKRERADKMSGFDLACKREDRSKFEEKSSSMQREMWAEEGANSVQSKKFEFEGDWPSTASLDQRQERRRERRNDNDGCLEKAMGNNSGATNQSSKTKDMSNPDMAESQKLFDLIQTGAEPICTNFSPLLPIFPSSEDDPNISPDQPQGSRSENKEQIVKEAISVELPDCVLNSEAVGVTLVRENEPDINGGANDNITSGGEVCESSDCESESSHSGDMPESQEQKQHHTRRSGKQCKLAMTFTQNCLEASEDSVQSSAAVQTNDGQSLELKAGSNSCTEANMRKEVDPLSCSFTQTESQDFAILWRVNENNFNASDKSSSDVSILCSNPIRFVPCATASVNLTNCEEIPYSVVHEKSTQVEEEELGPTQDVLENLDILKRHFKQVTLDTLEDLFEKCHQNLEWTTNLLLDSGERFFRDDESEEDISCTGGVDKQTAGNGPSSDLMNILQFEELAGYRPDVLVEEIECSSSTCSEPSTSETNNCDYTAAPGILDGVTLPQENNKNSNATLQLIKGNGTNLTYVNTQVEVKLPCEGENSDTGAGRTEGLDVQTEDDIRSISEIHRLLQDELEELEREEKARRKNAKLKKTQLFDIKSVELKLPTELAFQLTELFGPVDVDQDTGSPEDYVLQMDLNLAKLLHQKWKESVKERQKQAALSYRLLQESSSHCDKPPQWTVPGSSPARFQMSSGGTSHLDSHPDLPFMDHWNMSKPHVSLRDIIKEELALQENREKVRQSRADLEQRDGATLLKEDQLFALFPTIDRHFLQDIFRDHNYSLTQTQLFLHSLLDDEPVKTVVAPEPPHVVQLRATSKDRDKKSVEPDMPSYQDTEDPEYQDFRAEANLQRKRQLESFAKAAEAYKQGHKEVASFYAQQGHLHGQRMREANHRAAVQIFQRVNSSLLPRNILDLHGLHVEEALEHLGHVLETKTTECVRGLCRPQLSVITGRGNHSQGGVARIRPAVLDYLTKKHYRFTEPKPGLVLVSLK